MLADATGHGIGPALSVAHLHAMLRMAVRSGTDLAELVREGSFREDLYYRRAVVVLRSHPLREHTDDIPSLVGHLTEQFCREYNRRPKKWGEKALRQLVRHAWPGNVRELRNLVERLVILTPGPVIAYVFTLRARGKPYTYHSDLERTFACPPFSAD